MAEDVPTRGAHDSRIRFVDYNPDQVVRINGVFRAASQIVFREGETIATVALGDTVSWEVAPADNALFIKPRESAPPTSLLVVTKRGGVSRSYIFRSEEHTSELQSLMRISYAVFCLKKKKTANHMT